MVALGPMRIDSGGRRDSHHNPIYPSANEQTNSEPLGPSLKNWSGQPSNGGVKTEMSLGWHKVPLQASKHE